MRTVEALPKSVQRRLAGRPVTIDGQRLDPEVQLLIRLLGRDSQATHETPAEARATRTRQAVVFRGESFDVGRVEDLTIISRAMETLRTSPPSRGDFRPFPRSRWTAFANGVTSRTAYEACPTTSSPAGSAASRPAGVDGSPSIAR